MLTATLTFPALGIRTRAAFLAGLEVAPTLSLAQPGDGSAVFTLADTTAEVVEDLRRKLEAFGSSGLSLSFAEAAPEVEAVDLEVVAETLPLAEESAAVDVVVEVEVEVVTAVDAPIEAEPAEIVEGSVDESVVVHLSGAPARELVEQGQALVRSLQAGTYTFGKPSTGWKGSSWCVRFATVNHDALCAAMANLLCVASFGEELSEEVIPAEITVEVTAEIEAAGPAKASLTTARRPRRRGGLTLGSV